MTKMAEELLERHFGDDVHPYLQFEHVVESLLPPKGTLLDAGCGRTAPVLVKYRQKASRLIGVDVVEFDPSVKGLELYLADMVSVPVESGCVDVIMARAVMEHVTEPERVYAEMFRLLKPGGHFTFLTGNIWDYAAPIAMAVPQRWHPWLISKIQGRPPEDVFPVAYKTNSKSTVTRLAKAAGFEVTRFDYVGQYPAYFMFNGPLFLLATGYEKLIRKWPSLHFLQGWIMVTLRRPA
jgi:SAM-dependent methyltransferase